VPTPAAGRSDFYTQTGIARSYVAARSERFESGSTEWIDLPNAATSFDVGGPESPSYGAVLIATFTADALSTAAGQGNALLLDILFDDNQGTPTSQDGNYRFTSAAPGREWSSQSTIRTYIIEPRPNLARVKVKVRVKNTNAGQLALQNWTLRVDRYNL
jgi:hypothetical protein